MNAFATKAEDVQLFKENSKMTLQAFAAIVAWAHQTS
jgi:hypothetical protein